MTFENCCAVMSQFLRRYATAFGCFFGLFLTKQIQARGISILLRRISHFRALYFHTSSRNICRETCSSPHSAHSHSRKFKCFFPDAVLRTESSCFSRLRRHRPSIFRGFFLGQNFKKIQLLEMKF